LTTQIRVNDAVTLLCYDQASHLRVNTLTTLRLVQISRSLASYSRHTNPVCSCGAFVNVQSYRGRRKQVYQIPKLELLADAETFYNLHSLCLDENDRVRSSKAPVRVHACVCEFCCHMICTEVRVERDEKKAFSSFLFWEATP